MSAWSLMSTFTPVSAGLDSSVANKIYVIRRVPGATEAKVIRVGLNKAKFDAQENIRLAAGDVVSVEQTLATAGLRRAPVADGHGPTVQLPMAK